MSDGIGRRRWGRRATRLVALLAMLGLSLGACHSRVQQGLDEKQAEQVVGALRRAGVQAQRVKQSGPRRRYAVQVPRGQVSRAVQVLCAAQLPRDRPPGFDQVYGQPSLLPGRAEQRARYEQALAGELARTLESVAGVQRARVHLVVPVGHPLALGDAPVPKPRAAVFLRVRAGAAPLEVAEIRRLVAGGVHDLAPSRVEVIVHQSQPSPPWLTGPRLVQVGPVTVTADSRGLLIGLFAGGLLLLVLCGAAIAALAWRLRRRLSE